MFPYTLGYMYAQQLIPKYCVAHIIEEIFGSIDCLSSGRE